MHVLLPPSETKAPGGDGSPLDLDSLLFPELRPQREQLARAVGALAKDLPTARAALKVSAAKDAEIASNGLLGLAPTLPALERYTGVLYDSLAPAGMSAADKARAWRRIIVISALFGAVRASDAIPAYRLSAGSTVPGLGTIPAIWRHPLAAALSRLPGPVLDLRSGAYAAFARLPDAITVRVVTEQADGRRITVSHANKTAKGTLARLVATAHPDITTCDGVLHVARAHGMRIEQLSSRPTALEIVT